MKKSILKGAILGLSLLSGITASAQLTLDGQYRPRLEVRNGFKKPLAEKVEPSAFVEHRARLTTGYKQDKLGFKLSIQDVRIWGETGQINKTDQGLSVHEAYGDYYASKVSTFRIGRQEMKYDGDRFIGALNWAAQARSFDAVRYMYKNDSSAISFDIALTYNQDGLAAGSAPEPAKLTNSQYTTVGGPASANGVTTFNLALPKAQQLFYIKYKFGAGDVGLMLVNEIRESFERDIDNNVTDQLGTPFNQFHIGLTPNFKFGDYKLGLQAYYSGGTFSKYQNAEGGFSENKLGGYMASLTFQATEIKTKPLIGVDYISGDDETTSDVEGWAPLYGTNHKFYGFMDYFFVGNGHGGVDNASAGLLDIYLKTTIKAGEKNKILAHLHNFSSTTERTYAATGEKYKGGLGTEIDIVFVRNLAPGVVFKAGYSQMFGISETMNVLKGYAPDAKIKGVQNWGWVMINFTPQLLKK